MNNINVLIDYINATNSQELVLEYIRNNGLRTVEQIWNCYFAAPETGELVMDFICLLNK